MVHYHHHFFVAPTHVVIALVFCIIVIAQVMKNNMDDTKVWQWAGLQGPTLSRLHIMDSGGFTLIGGTTK